MTKQGKRARPIWTDRFASPTAEELLGALDGGAAAYTGKLRATLNSDGLTESVRWCGLPWRWAFVYASPEEGDTAFLVPNPEGPSVVFRLSHEQFADLPTRKLSRFIRDGLAQTRLVAGVSWPEWTFQSQGQVKDLVELFGLLADRSLTST